MSEEILPTEEQVEATLFDEVPEGDVEVEVTEESEGIDEPEVGIAEEPEPEPESDVESEPEPEAVEEPEVEVTEEPEVEPKPEPSEAPESGPVHGVSWVPFSVYLGAWVVLAVATAVGLREAAIAGGALWSPEYVYTVYGGVGLAAFGPILSLIVWLVARSRRERGDRAGLLTSALLRGAGAAFLGSILWLVSLYILDLYRTGVIA